MSRTKIIGKKTGRNAWSYTLCTALVIGYSAAASAGQVTLSWDASTDSAVGGYKLRYGTAKGSYTQTIDVSKATSYTVSNLADGATYYFVASAYDTGRTQESGYSNEVAFVAAPVAKFSASPASGSAKAGQAVTFTDASQGSVTSRSWNLGNGVTSTAQSASTNYATAGTYTVTLNVTGPGGTSKSTQSYVVQAASSTAPAANFTPNPASGAAPLPVTFANTTTGSATSWSWKFGDGATSTAQSPSHTYAAAGTYTVVLTATGSGGSSSKSATINVTAGGTGAGGTGGTSSNGLVAAYGFEETAGTTVFDASGAGNNGTISNAARTNVGRFGRALSFNGTNAWVTAKDAASLDLSKAMTVEAWVNPAVSLSGWASIVAKEASGTNAVELMANTGSNQPGIGLSTSKWWELPGGTSLPANTWKHLAATYDGATLKMYVDGTQVAQGAVTGGIQVTDGVLRIGGNSVWGEYFNGRIDEVRVYNRALSQAEIASDRARPVLSSLWKPTMAPANAASSDTSAVELGVKFKSDVAGYITGLRFYKSSTNTGTHVASLWKADGTLLSRATFSGETASGWQQVNFPSPVAVSANTVYVASYHTNVGRYAFNENFFATAGTDTAPLHALGGSADNKNGVYAYGANPVFPNASYQSTNYWVDVFFRR